MFRSTRSILFVLVLAVAFGCAQAGPPADDGTVEKPRDGVFIHVSHGPEDAHRVLMALKMAELMAADHDVLVYLDIHGIDAVLADAPDIEFSHFPSSHTQIARLLEQQPDGSSAESVLFDLEYKRHVFRWVANAIRAEFHDRTWQAFWRTCVEGEAIPEVAADLNVSAGSVYVARSRVMARLRQKVEQFERE